MGSSRKTILSPPTSSYISSSSAFLTYSCSACFKEEPKHAEGDSREDQDETDEYLREVERNTFEYALKSNEAWANYKGHQNPAFFEKLATGQSPSILWLGCSDSRVPETTLLGLQPGDIFVHRNIANIVSPTDINSMAVIEYAVVHLKVKHIVICGHTCCGGAAAALGNSQVGGVIDAWITPLRTLRKNNETELKALGDDGKRAVRLAELNVEYGVGNLMSSWIVEEAIRERGLTVHGVLYDIACGKIRDLGVGTAEKENAGAASSAAQEQELVKGNHGMLVFSGDVATMAMR
ncbi:hypothetical protein VTL71DRAFT_766 [Oculimacula yallundae]|uniref:Carbonic anhydrase n=1 Tax=Oculimacula yallundae TaxID=86028 RepID=A0ABR4D120_9HELO